MKRQVKCLECGNPFFSPVEKIWVAMAKDKVNESKMRMLGGNKKKEAFDNIKLSDNEVLDLKRILAPKEQFCQRCKNVHRQRADMMRNQEKHVNAQRARQLGQDPNTPVIRAIPEDEAKAFDRYTVYRKVQQDWQTKIQEEQKVKEKEKSDKEAVDAAMLKLAEIKKEREQNEVNNGPKEGANQEDKK
jgi:hypothetical protein